MSPTRSYLVKLLPVVLMVLATSLAEAQTSRPYRRSYPTSRPSWYYRGSRYPSSQPSGDGEKLTDEALNSRQVRALYSWPARAWMESLYYAGRPSAKAYAYGIFEGPELGASFLAGGPGGVGAKVTKDAIFEVAEEYIDHPEKVAEGLANAMMKKGLEAYRRNYSRYKQWKSGDGMSMRGRDAFVQDFREVNYYALGKELWGDVQLYKHKQGKYKSADADMKKFRDLLKSELAQAAKASGAWDVAMTAKRVKDIVDAARDGLAAYQPYKDHLDRVRKIETSDGFELPHAKIAKLTQSHDQSKEPTPQYKMPPARPSVDVYKAIELGNAEQVWANIYYKTFDINGERRRIPPLFYTFIEALKTQRRTHKPSDAHNHIIKLLLDKGANPNAEFEDVTPLYVAVKYRNIDAAKALLAKGAKADVSGRRETPLEMAAERGDLDMVKLLVAHGARIDGSFVQGPSSSRVRYGGSGESPLYAAIDNRHTRVALYLLDKGANVNAGSRYGGTPLHAAVARRSSAMVAKLLASGAQPDMRDRRRNTPLHVAAASGQDLCVRLLLRVKADMRMRMCLATNKRGNTPIQTSLQNGHLGTASILIAETPDVVRGTDGQRFLIQAVTQDNMKFVRFLLGHGASGDAATLFRICYEKRHRRMLDFWAERMGNLDRYVIQSTRQHRHGSRVTSVAFSESGKLIAIGDDGLGVAVLEWPTLNSIYKVTFSKHYRRSRRGTTIFGKPIYKAVQSYGGPATTIFLDDSRLVAAACYQVYLVDCQRRSKREIVRHSNPDTVVATSSNRKRMLAWNDKVCELRELPDGRLIRAISDAKGAKLADLSADGHTACLFTGSKVVLVSADTGKELQRLPTARDVTSLRFSPDGDEVAVSYSNGTIRLFGSRSGSEIARLNGHTAAVTCLNFASGGTSLLTGSADKTIRIWDIRRKAEVRCFWGSQGSIRSVCLSPSGRYLVGGDSGGALHIWDMSNNATLDQWIRSRRR